MTKSVAGANRDGPLGGLALVPPFPSQHKPSVVLKQDGGIVVENFISLPVKGLSLIFLV